MENELLKVTAPFQFGKHIFLPYEESVKGQALLNLQASKQMQVRSLEEPGAPNQSGLG